MESGRSRLSELHALVHRIYAEQGSATKHDLLERARAAGISDPESEFGALPAGPLPLSTVIAAVNRRLPVDQEQAAAQSTSRSSALAPQQEAEGARAYDTQSAGTAGISEETKTPGEAEP